MKKYLVFLGIVALVCFALVAAQQKGKVAAQVTEKTITNFYQGMNYVTSVDNSVVYKVEPAQIAQTYCTKENPCLYDDLPFGLAEYVLVSGPWPNYKFTYSVPGFGSGDQPWASERGVIAQAFGLWADASNAKMSEKLDDGGWNGDVRIWWASGDHGDGYPFDGPGGVLAHCFYPPPLNSGAIAGDMHFDEDETWSTVRTGGGGIDLATVAAHEMGHAFGLGHSSDPNALMYPYYSARRPWLSSDDIAGIIALYKNQPNDLTIQIEEVYEVGMGGGSFRLREDSISLWFRKAGTSTYLYKTMPHSSVDTGGSFTDVDGVWARNDFGSGGQFDGYWWHLGDLYRQRLVLPVSYADVDLVIVQLNLTNNILTGWSNVLRVSINGKVLGDITVNPGDTVVTAYFYTHFVNSVDNCFEVAGKNLYNEVKH